MILRPENSGDHREYSIVGGAYIDGIMDGEAVEEASTNGQENDPDSIWTTFG